MLQFKTQNTNFTERFCIINTTRYRVTRLTETPVRTARPSVVDFHETHVWPTIV